MISKFFEPEAFIPVILYAIFALCLYLWIGRIRSSYSKEKQPWLDSLKEEVSRRTFQPFTMPMRKTVKFTQILFFSHSKYDFGEKRYSDDVVLKGVLFVHEHLYEKKQDVITRIRNAGYEPATLCEVMAWCAANREFVWKKEGYCIGAPAATEESRSLQTCVLRKSRGNFPDMIIKSINPVTDPVLYLGVRPVVSSS